MYTRHFQFYTTSFGSLGWEVGHIHYVTEILDVMTLSCVLSFVTEILDVMNLSCVLSDIAFAFR